MGRRKGSKNRAKKAQAISTASNVVQQAPTEESKESKEVIE